MGYGIQNDDLAGSKIKTLISPVTSRITEKHTQGGAKGKFKRRCDVWIAKLTKHAKEKIKRSFMKESSERSFIMNGCGMCKVENMRCHMESFEYSGNM